MTTSTMPSGWLDHQANDQLNVAISELRSLAERAKDVAVTLAKIDDPDSRLWGEVGWWADHSQGLAFTARTVELHLNRALAFHHSANMIRAVEAADR